MSLTAACRRKQVTPPAASQGHLYMSWYVLSSLLLILSIFVDIFSLWGGFFIMESCCVAGNAPSFQRSWEKQIRVRAFPDPLQPRHRHVAQALLVESNSPRQKRVTQRERDKGRVALRGFQWHWWQNPRDRCCMAAV